MCSIGNFQIENTKKEKLLSIQSYNKLQKLYALGRVTPYMNLLKRKILMNAFFKSQFSYCPLIWMCHSRIINKKNKQTT